MRHGGDLRGSSYARRQRKAWLLAAFGTGKTCPCHWCGKRLTFNTLTQDRIIPGEQGGRYVRSNLVPACLKCNQTRHVARPKVRRIPWYARDYTTKQFLASTR